MSDKQSKQIKDTNNYWFFIILNLTAAYYRLTSLAQEMSVQDI